MCAQRHLLGCGQLFLHSASMNKQRFWHILLASDIHSRITGNMDTGILYESLCIFTHVYPVTSTNLHKCDNMCFVSCHTQHRAKFEVLAAVVLKTQVLWDTMPCCAMSDSDISEDCITFIFERTWRHYNPSKCPNTLTQWHRSTFQKPESRMWSAH